MRRDPSKKNHISHPFPQLEQNFLRESTAGGVGWGHSLRDEAVPCMNAWDCALRGLHQSTTASFTTAALGKTEGQQGF